MRLKDNYFGRFTHYSTVQEYIEKRDRGLVGDPIDAKYRQGKVNINYFNILRCSLMLLCRSRTLLKSACPLVFLTVGSFFRRKYTSARPPLSCLVPSFRYSCALTITS